MIYMRNSFVNRTLTDERQPIGEGPSMMGSNRCERSYKTGRTSTKPEGEHVKEIGYDSKKIVDIRSGAHPVWDVCQWMWRSIRVNRKLEYV